MDDKFFDTESARCLGCKVKPCAKGCPLGVSPCDFIAAAKSGDFAKAAALIAKANPMPLTCGYICPDCFCQKVCIRAKAGGAIRIPKLQEEVMKRGGLPALDMPPLTGKKAAVIGGGPAGLGAVFEFLRNGWAVDLYEKTDKLGGALRLIPDYRLSKDALEAEIERLTQNQRVKVFLETEIEDFDKLKEAYDGVVTALGEPEPRGLGVTGEEYALKYAAYLSAPLGYKGKKAAVSGGGEVALDCALTLKKQGFDEVHMFVRRRKEDMRIMQRDFAELEKAGVVIYALSSITAITKDKAGYTLEVAANVLDENGRAVDAGLPRESLNGYDFVITALGSTFPKAKLPQGVFHAGDMTGNAGTAVQAIASGMAAARNVIAGGEVR